MEVITLKLVNGEEWIAKRRRTLDDDTYVLESVRKLQLVPNGKGGTGLALLPIVMGNVDADEVVISAKHVIMSIAVDSTFERQYLQEVSGIQLT